MLVKAHSRSPVKTCWKDEFFLPTAGWQRFFRPAPKKQRNKSEKAMDMEMELGVAGCCCGRCWGTQNLLEMDAMFWVDFIGSPHVTLANTKVQPLKSCQKLSFRQKVEGFFWGQTKKSTSKIHVFFSGGHESQSLNESCYIVVWPSTLRG